MVNKVLLIIDVQWYGPVVCEPSKSTFGVYRPVEE